MRQPFWPPRRRTPAVGEITPRQRICVVGPGFRFLGGLSVYTWNVTQALRAEFDVSVLLMRRLLPRRLYPGSARVGRDLTSLSYEQQPHFDGIDWYWGRSLFSALAFLKRSKPEVLVLQWWTAAVGHTYLLLALLARMARVPILVEIHEVQDPGEADRGAIRTYGKWVLGALLKMTDGLLLHHEADRELLELEGHDIERQRVAFAPHGPYAQLAAIQPVQPAELARHALTAEAATCTNVLFFGLIRPYKGLEDLVTALDTLPRASAEKLVVTIVGETWEGTTEPLDLLSTSSNNDRVRVVNRYVSDAEAAFVFSEADVLVLPYRRASSSGPLHIAMAQGIPVIMYDLPALRIAASGYPGATFVPAGDVAALRDAVTDLAARPRARHDSSGDWQTTVEAYRRLLNEVSRR